MARGLQLIAIRSLRLLVLVFGSRLRQAALNG